MDIDFNFIETNTTYLIETVRKGQFLSSEFLKFKIPIKLKTVRIEILLFFRLFGQSLPSINPNYAVEIFCSQSMG